MLRARFVLTGVWLGVCCGVGASKANATSYQWAADSALSAAPWSACPRCNRTQPGTDPSSAITGITTDYTTLRRLANQADMWPATWADDGNLYTFGNDGMGWGTTYLAGWTLNRLSGLPTGDLRSQGVLINTKPVVLGVGITSIGSRLYIVEAVPSGERGRFGHSDDHGLTWVYPAGSGWDYDSTTRPCNLAGGRFVQFGQANSGAMDEYVYLYTGGTGAPGNVGLARAPAASVDVRSTHEYFAGLDDAGAPTWTRDPRQCKPVLTLPRTNWGNSLSYNPVLQRFLLVEFVDSASTAEFYDAPKPWGPFTLVTRIEALGGDTMRKFDLNFINKPGWLSADGLTWWAVLSGVGRNTGWDSFNALRFTLSATGSLPPPPSLPGRESLEAH